MRPIFRLPLIAAAIGALIALGLVSAGAAATAALPSADVVAQFFVVLCPPWEILWAGIEQPHNSWLWLNLSAAVVLANALLYVPLGLVYAITNRFKPWAQCVVVTLATVLSLGLGHLFFIP